MPARYVQLMQDTPSNSIESILKHALKLTDLKERNEFVNNAVKGDEVLLEQIKFRLKETDATIAGGKQADRRSDSSHKENQIVSRPSDSSTVDYEKIAAGGAEAFEDALNASADFDLDATNQVFVIGDQVDRFLIKQEISSGAFGMVFLAEDVALQRAVALKVPRQGSKVEGQSYIDEARAVARLQHPGIVQVYAAGWFDDATPFVAMQYVEGCSLESVMRDAPGSSDKMVSILADVADAIHHAHQNGIIHRDLKPENILVDQNERPYVADFGLSLTEGTQKASRGDQSGTPLFRSPEQVRGEAHRMDGRSDIWSIGIILYRSLTGRYPFSGKTRDALNDEILHKSPKPPRQINDHLSEELQEICLKCLQKRPEDRYQTADSLAKTLRTSLSTHDRLAIQVGRANSPPKAQVFPSGYLPMDHPPDQVVRRELTIFGDKVKSSWIDSFYKEINTPENHILISKSSIDTKKEKTQGTDWHGQEDAEASVDISHQRMSAIFRENGSLLIVGEAGAGKTMAMLEIVEEMLSVSMREDSGNHARVPFVLNLSSWKKSQSLEQWIISELHSKYEIPSEISKHWLEKDFLIPMLDGLDEVRSVDRMECLQAINRFIDHYKPYVKANGIVVCCRSYDYLWMTEPLRLRKTIRLEPLNAAQVNEYFSRIEPGLKRLEKAIAYDPKFKELVKTPLMVGVTRVAIAELRDADFDTALRGVEGSLRDRVFNLYIQQMFKFNQSKYAPSHKRSLISLLSWFAKRMQADGKTVLMIEEMQPHWLESRLDQLIYGSMVAVSVGLVYGVLLGLSFGLFSTFSFGISSAVLLGIAGGVGLLAGGYANSKWISGSIGGAFFGLLFGLSVGSQAGLHSGIEFGLIGGLSFALICSVGVGGLRQISLIENVSWRWRGARSTLAYGIVVGICSGVLFSISRARSGEWDDVLLSALTYVFGFGMVGALISGILGGMKNSTSIARAQPNQGITMSFRNAMIGALVFGMSFGICGAVLSWLGYGLSGGQGGGIAAASVDGLVALSIGGLIGGLNRGGAAFLKHYALRFVLQFRGMLPKRLIQELDLCASMNFLKKVGGGYMFAHGFLMEYFSTKVPFRRESKESSDPLSE